MFNFNTLFGPSDQPSRAIPSTNVAPEFGEVSIREVGDRVQVAAALAMGAFLLGDGESCKTGLALDASQSMQEDYGRSRTIPKEISRQFIEKGMFQTRERDGVVRKVLSKEAKKIAMEKGLTVNTPNIVEKPCASLIDNIIRTFVPGGASSGTCEVIYWACGPEGKDIESLGDIACQGLETLKIQGPRQQPFGPKTFLAPPLRYFTSQAGSDNGIFVFVTDGHIDDEADVIAETHRLAAEIQSGQRSDLKCVLLGVGQQVDRQQLCRIDDMEMPEGLTEIDIWNAKVLGEMRDMNDAWSEIFDPRTVIGTSIRVFNDQGELVHEKTDEVAALITFEMPAGSQSFELVLDGEMKIQQSLV